MTETDEAILELKIMAELQNKAALAKKLAKEKLRPGEYINQLIREDLNEGGCL